MNETLREFVDSRGVAIRVDREAGVIRGVKVLGLKSRNGRTYLPDALVQAVALYEGAKVNVNHAKTSPFGPRDYQDRIGVIRNVQSRRDEGLFADFHFNPKHALSEQLLWDAEHAPENLGFSHNVQARTSRRGEEVVVEAILGVESVDLVADPATTRGLFESAGDAGDADAAPTLAEATVEHLRRHRADLVEAIVSEPTAEIERLRAEVERLRLAEAMAQKNRLVRRLLSEAELPDPDSGGPWARSIVSRRFIETLLAAPDEAAILELIEERAKLVREIARRGLARGAGECRPQCREQNQFELVSPPDAAAFVRAIVK
ncbi:MAG: hypothetical protein NTW96_07010 [Planctomycetia bacterium]|nr:hypothetical protein [Planctomycetia bacterium]